MSKKQYKVMGLDERALLVKLSIGRWSGQKTDANVTNEVAERHKADKASGKYRKRLVTKTALKEIDSIAGAARSAHNMLTLPWTDDGARVITTESYEHYSKVMRDFRDKMQAAVDEFIKTYDDHVIDAKEALGTMFDPDDYPPRNVVKSKFTFDVEPSPIPMKGDFRAKVSNEEAAIIAKDIEARSKMRLEHAMRDVWERVADVTEKMVDRLSAYKPKEGLHRAENTFRDSLVYNVEELARVLPSLNITNDPKLDELQKELLNKLCHYDPQQLREDSNARAQTAKEAKAILKKVGKFLG